MPPKLCATSDSQHYHRTRRYDGSCAVTRTSKANCACGWEFRTGWCWLKTPGNLRRVQHPMRTISHQFIYKWPMNKNDRISMWRHSRICGGTSVVQPHGVELFNFQTRDLWASLTLMSKLAPFSRKPFWINTDFYWTRYKYIRIIYIYIRCCNDENTPCINGPIKTIK